MFDQDLTKLTVERDEWQPAPPDCTCAEREAKIRDVIAELKLPLYGQIDARETADTWLYAAKVWQSRCDAAARRLTEILAA